MNQNSFIIQSKIYYKNKHLFRVSKEVVAQQVKTLPAKQET